MDTREQLEKEQQQISGNQKTLFDSNAEIWKSMHVAQGLGRADGLQQLADNARTLRDLAERERAIYFELLQIEKP